MEFSSPFMASIAAALIKAALKEKVKEDKGGRQRVFEGLLKLVQL